MDINWDEVPEGFDYALTTAPDWEGGSEYKGTVRFAKKRGNSTYFECSEGLYPHVGRGSWAVLATRPEKWNGKGLPPVGTVCECQNNELKWLEGTIVHVGIHGSTKLAVMQTKEEILYGEVGEFRPIKTKEQIAAEEREKAIEEMVQFFMNYYGNPKGAEQYLLICRSLHDAGYRKQEDN